MKSLSLVIAVLLLSGPSLASEHLDIGGRDRTYSIYRPPGLGTGKSVPLVIVLHGGFGTGSQAEKSYRWNDLAQIKGFVVVYPDGYRRSWNAGGGCCGPAVRGNVDDLGFLTAIIRTVSKNENIDQHRIYLTGISNGAAMSYRYACSGPVVIAAIGSVSGAMPGGCQSPRPVSVMEIHGLKDQNIPFAGGVGTKGVAKVDWLGVEQSLDVFRKADHCGAADTTAAGTVTTSTYNCSQGNQVSLITITDAGHQWPGSESNRPLARLLLDLDSPSRALDATSVLWDFFQRHSAL